MKLTSNARFWIWENDSRVKITLRPDQRLTWGRYTRHDEGYTSASYTWEWDGETLTEQFGSDGTDCDGRLSTSSERCATLAQLRGVQAYDWHDFDYPLPAIKLPVDGVFYPAWTDGRRSQRDYSAEAAGY
jgi:hypothetical protein